MSPGQMFVRPFISGWSIVSPGQMFVRPFISGWSIVSPGQGSLISLLLLLVAEVRLKGGQCCTGNRYCLFYNFGGGFVCFLPFHYV